MDVLSAPEIKGRNCPVCGSNLLQLDQGIWCDWCNTLQGDNKMTIDTVLENLDQISLEGSLMRSDRARSLLESLVEDARDSGYSDGYDEGYDSGYDSGRDNY